MKRCSMTFRWKVEVGLVGSFNFVSPLHNQAFRECGFICVCIRICIHALCLSIFNSQLPKVDGS